MSWQGLIGGIISSTGIFIPGLKLWARLCIIIIGLVVTFGDLIFMELF